MCLAGNRGHLGYTNEHLIILLKIAESLENVILVYTNMPTPEKICLYPYDDDDILTDFYLYYV